MTILVTGGAGYIGSHVVKQLSDRGEKVIVLDNLSTGFPEALLHGETLIRADVRAPVMIDKVFEQYQIDTVLHFAASLIVPESMLDPLKYYVNNVSGMINFLSSCVKYKVKNFVLSSTAAVYGVTENGFCSEESAFDPASPYGASKAMIERVLADVASVENMNYVILRYFNVAGADPSGKLGQNTRNATHLIKVCCQAATGMRGHVEIYGDDYPTADGTCIRDYVHVEDLASAHLLALDHMKKTRTSLMLNVGYGAGSSVKEVVETTQRVTGVKFKVTTAGRRSGDASRLVAKADKIKEILHWKPEYASLERIISDSFEWEKKLKGRKPLFPIHS